MQYIIITYLNFCLMVSTTDEWTTLSRVAGEQSSVITHSQFWRAFRSAVEVSSKYRDPWTSLVCDKCCRSLEFDPLIENLRRLILREVEMHSRLYERPTSWLNSDLGDRFIFWLDAASGTTSSCNYPEISIIST